MNTIGLLLVVFSLSSLNAYPRDGYTCETNSWDNHQWCLCHPGERVGSIHSEWSNKYLDRQWTLKCETIQPEFLVEDDSHWYEETPASTYDGKADWDGESDDKFLVGMTSEDSNKYNDRQFKFFAAHSDNWYLSDCEWHNKVNSLHQDLDYGLATDEVFAGLKSVHDNGQEDRSWDLKVCKLRKKCTEITSIVYDTHASGVDSEEMVAAHGSFDNTHGSSTNSLTVTISQKTGQSLTESYSYSQTSGTEQEISMSVSAGYTIGFPMVDEFSLEVTVGTSASWNFQETWTRSNSKTYSEENGHQMTFTENCKSGCKCEMDVMVTTATAEVPYVMKSQSVDGVHKCVEEGTLTVDISFDGRAIVMDQC